MAHRTGERGKNHLLIIVPALALALLAGCAAGPNQLTDSPNAEAVVAGFWYGLWHGMIAPITFIISLFNPDVRIYEVHNNGGWYDFGFLFGTMLALGGCGRGAGGRKEKKNRRIGRK